MRMRGLGVAMVAALAVPAGAQGRGLTVKVPRVITAQKLFTVTWQGDTGPRNPNDRGSFGVRVLLVPGACPVGKAATRGNPRHVVLAAQTTPNATPIRGAARRTVPAAGTYRLCGYVTRPVDPNLGGTSDYELLVDRPRVRVRSGSARTPQRPPKPKAGTYLAKAQDTAGGASTAGVTVTIAGGKVTAIAVTGLTLSVCADGLPTAPALNTTVDVASTAGPSESIGPSSGEILGSTMLTVLAGPAPDGSIGLSAGFANDREIRGIVHGTTGAGVCSGAMAFTARRR